MPIGYAPIHTHTLRRAKCTRGKSCASCQELALVEYVKAREGHSAAEKASCEGPIPIPGEYLALFNTPQGKDEKSALKRSKSKDVAFGADRWVLQMVKGHSPKQTL